MKGASCTIAAGARTAVQMSSTRYYLRYGYPVPPAARRMPGSVVDYKSITCADQQYYKQAGKRTLILRTFLKVRFLKLYGAPDEVLKNNL